MGKSVSDLSRLRSFALGSSWLGQCLAGSLPPFPFPSSAAASSPSSSLISRRRLVQRSYTTVALQPHHSSCIFLPHKKAKMHSALRTSLTRGAAVSTLCAHSFLLDMDRHTRSSWPGVSWMGPGSVHGRREMRRGQTRVPEGKRKFRELCLRELGNANPLDTSGT